MEVTSVQLSDSENEKQIYGLDTFKFLYSKVLTGEPSERIINDFIKLNTQEKMDLIRSLRNMIVNRS